MAVNRNIGVYLKEIIDAIFERLYDRYTKEETDEFLTLLREETDTQFQSVGESTNFLMNKLNTHMDDTVAHITEDERTAWNGKQDKATTLEGYGIADAYTKDETMVLIEEYGGRANVITQIDDTTLVLENKQDAQLGELTELILTMPDAIESTYQSNFSFVTGDEAPVITDWAGLIWKGDDVDGDGVFTPQVNTMYEVNVKCIGKTNEKPVIVARVGAV